MGKYGKTKSCKYCGSSFESSKEHIFYCSKECSRKSVNDRWRVVKRIETAERHKKNKKLLEEKLGTECRICHNHPKRIVYHEIHGKAHDRKSYSYQLKHLENFIPLCYKCHQILHYLFKLGLVLKNFEDWLEILKNGENQIV